MATCRNATCECTARSGSDYCSRYCANVDQSETIPGYNNDRGGCACGHEECHINLRRAPHESEIAVGPHTGDS